MMDCSVVCFFPGEVFIISEVMGKIDKLLHVNKWINTSNCSGVEKQEAVHCLWKETWGVWEWICFAICFEKRISTNFGSRRPASRLEGLHYIFGLSLLYIPEGTKILSSQTGVWVQSASVLLSQTWGSRLFFMLIGAPGRRVKLQQSSTQVVDSNTRNQQHSYLVLHNYFLGWEIHFNRWIPHTVTVPYSACHIGKTMPWKVIFM